MVTFVRAPNNHVKKYTLYRETGEIDGLFLVPIRFNFTTES